MARLHFPAVLARNSTQSWLILLKLNTACTLFIKETLINSEFPQHMDVLPFSVADMPLKMKNKIKSHFILFVL